jgi:hypothetical protein
MHRTELPCTLLSFTASFLGFAVPFELHCTLWAMLHPLSYAAHHWAAPVFIELKHTLLSYSSRCWAMIQPSELPSFNLRSYAIPFWTTLHLMNNAAPYWATLHPLSCTAPFWAKVHPAELHSTPYELAHPNWATLHPTELFWTILSYAEPYWASLYPTELRYSLLSYAAPVYLSYLQYSFLCAILTNAGMPECRTVRYRNATVPDWDAGYRNTDAGGIGLDADAQLCGFINLFIFFRNSKSMMLHSNNLF